MPGGGKAPGTKGGAPGGTIGGIPEGDIIGGGIGADVGGTAYAVGPAPYTAPEAVSAAGAAEPSDAPMRAL